ncbi:MAG TPA: ATPase domain-containing protein [Oscillospiraceae bacterium]|nr:ATPase domain-containing protein [Oscillospiraceae bacterium]
MDRIKSGIESLDYVLHGGIPTGSSVLIVGTPGTGKTILVNQIVFNNSSAENKVLYFATMSEPQIKIMKFQQEFSYFDINKFQQSVIYCDLGSILSRDGTKRALAYIDELLLEYQPKIIVIDTIKTLSDMIQSNLEIRQFMLELSAKLAVWECTTFYLGEYTEKEIEERPESAIVDGIIYLSGTEEKKFQKRFLRILKMRGTSFESGEIFFKITSDGLNLFPRLHLDVSNEVYNRNFSQRLSSGNQDLDRLFGGGIPRSTVTIISGGTGTGKTLMSISFAFEGLRSGESVIYATFEENPKQLLNSALSIGMDLAPYIDSGKLIIVHISPVELDLDEHIFLIQDYVRKINASRLVIDSISSFELGVEDKIKYTDYIWSLTNFLKASGVTTVMIHEIHESIHVLEMTKHGISFVADNLILLQSKEIGLDMKRYVRIVKCRSSYHEMGLKEYQITKNGIQIDNETGQN